MKSFYKFLSIGAMIIAMASCSNEDKLAQQYVDACAENDFATAHAVLDKMEIDSDHGRNYRMYDHLDYVINKEVLYLVAQGDEQSTNRLLFLMKENKGNGNLKGEHIVNLAITQNNQYLVNKMLDTGVGYSPENLKAAMTANMDDIANRMMETEYDRLASESLPQLPPIGSPIKSDPSGGLSEHKKYNSSMEKHNRDCMDLLQNAIKYKNEKLATKIVALVKPYVTWQSLGEWKHVVEKDENGNSAYDAMKVSIDNTPVAEAKESLNMAKSNGEFN